MTLLGRYYERFADHAVSVAHRVVYLVTGEYSGDLTGLASLDHEEQEDALGQNGVSSGSTSGHRAVV